MLPTLKLVALLKANGNSNKRPMVWVRNGWVFTTQGDGKRHATKVGSLNGGALPASPDSEVLDRLAQDIERCITSLGDNGEMGVVVHSELYTIPGFVTLLEQRLDKQVHSDIDAVVSAAVRSQGDYEVLDVGHTTTQMFSLHRGPDGYSIKEKAKSSSAVVLERIASALNSFANPGTTQPELLHSLFDFSTVSDYNAVLADTNRYNINNGSFPEMPFNFRTGLKQVLTNELTNAEFFRVVSEELRGHAQSFKLKGALIVKSPLTSYSPMKACSTEEVLFLSELDLLSMAMDGLPITKRSSPKQVNFKAHPPTSVENTPCGLWFFCDLDQPSVQLAFDGKVRDVNIADLLPVLNKTAFKVGGRSMSKVHVGVDLDGCDNVVMKLRTIDGQVSERILN